MPRAVDITCVREGGKSSSLSLGEVLRKREKSKKFFVQDNYGREGAATAGRTGEIKRVFAS